MQTCRDCLLTDETERSGLCATHYSEHLHRESQRIADYARGREDAASGRPTLNLSSDYERGYESTPLPKPLQDHPPSDPEL